MKDTPESVNLLDVCYGKGPVDGIGGSTKRFVLNQVRSGKVQVMNAASFTQAAASMPKLNVSYMTAEEISERASGIGLQQII